MGALSRRTALLAAGVLLGGGSADAAASFLAQYRWKSRLLLIFAPRADDPALIRQRTIFHQAGPSGLSDRDLVVAEVTGDNVHLAAGGTTAGIGPALRRAFTIPDGGFRAVLVGKDGGAKLTSTDPVSPDRLYAVIDAMPMRRREVRGG